MVDSSVNLSQKDIGRVIVKSVAKEVLPYYPDAVLLKPGDTIDSVECTYHTAIRALDDLEKVLDELRSVSYSKYN